MNINKTIQMFIVWLCLSEAALATESVLFVSSDLDGNNANDCESWTAPCATIPHAVSLLNTAGTGGTIYLSQGNFDVGANSVAAEGIVISNEPIMLIGAGPEATVITLKPDEDDESLDVAIQINDLHNGDVRGSYSVIKDLKLTVSEGESGDGSGSSGGIEVDGAELVLIDNVWIHGFGNDRRASKHEPMDISPFAIKVHNSIADDQSGFDCSDWVKVRNSRMTDNYRGLVATTCSNGYLENVLIEDTGPGAAVYFTRKATGGGANFDFINSRILTKVVSTGSSSDKPVDNDYLVYLTYDDTSSKNLNISFVNVYSNPGNSTTKHYYAKSGYNQWLNTVFSSGNEGIRMASGSPKNIAGQFVSSATTPVNNSASAVKSTFWSVANTDGGILTDNEIDGLDADDDADSYSDSCEIFVYATASRNGSLTPSPSTCP